MRDASSLALNSAADVARMPRARPPRYPKGTKPRRNDRGRLAYAGSVLCWSVHGVAGCTRVLARDSHARWCRQTLNWRRSFPRPAVYKFDRMDVALVNGAETLIEVRWIGLNNRSMSRCPRHERSKRIVLHDGPILGVFAVKTHGGDDYVDFPCDTAVMILYFGFEGDAVALEFTNAAVRYRSQEPKRKRKGKLTKQYRALDAGDNSAPQGDLWLRTTSPPQRST
jgi:hypothetical protein